MKKFKYEVSISAESQTEADKRMNALMALSNKLSTDELVKAQEAVNNPIQLAVLRAKLS